MANDSKIDAPAQYRTAQRPGQTGDAAERQDGPSPLSSHPTGPHAPYEPHDPEGLAAHKHARSGTPATDAPAQDGPRQPSGTISVLGEDD